ncbi:lipid-A-disaccharide synthase [Panacibacter ginsenosidivorans]|uniref:Lipid-A-disaccharide synthase n=1 Tax=Panacibacter ginsenosidivorans TaxID=1813871 RepID=A0A5B8V458_9BACT|nr:lipid-A-disaccharide synthase [Panacibacter ginsenosidivorans]QEC66307.1 lipid-A-disaccharide synthase [Panacibacter ginsenosidivorans]
MKYYIIAGEASGDLHGSNLIKELKHLDNAANIHCWGGDLMQAAGGTLIKHYRDLAFMGFAEVVMNLRTIMNNLKFCKQDIEQFQPDVLVLIDYPGFNLRIAEWAKQKGFKVVFYISPQVWAWKEGRVKKMKQCIDKMLVILPFEKDYYKNKWNWDVEYVGHPLVEVIDSFIESQNSKPKTQNSKPVVALLPGSRKQEILKKLPIMLEVAKHFPDYEFVVAKAPGQEDTFYEPLLQPYSNVSSVRNETYKLLTQSTAALVTSGTATLETALFGVPEVVCYKGSNISYQIAKRLISIKYISLVNLIMDKPVVKELIQNDLTIKNLTAELSLILTDQKRIAEIKKDYADLKHLLSQGGNASAKAAKSIYQFMCNVE